MRILCFFDNLRLNLQTKVCVITVIFRLTELRPSVVHFSTAVEQLLMILSYKYHKTD